jgi:Uma2 family endonuclease
MIVKAKQAPAEQRFLLRNVAWPQYRAFAAALGERHVRLTYDGKDLELMTVSHGHVRGGEMLDRFLNVVTEEMDIPMQSGGSTTLNREDVERGLEPDRCYYLEHEYLVRDKDEIDLSVDPPPDLAIEIEISRSCLNRMAIYAALKVPELWRFDGSLLRVYHLTADGNYVEASASRHFPFLPIGEVQAFLLRRGQLDETKLVKSFRQWVREQIARGWAQP